MKTKREFQAGDLVVVTGRVDQGDEGEDLVGDHLTVKRADCNSVETNDGSVWHIWENGAWNLSVRGSKTAYQSGLYIAHAGV